MVVHDSHGNELPMDGRVNATPNMNASMQQQRADPRQQSRAEQRADSQQQQAGPQQSRDQTTNDHQSSANQLIDCQEESDYSSCKEEFSSSIESIPWDSPVDPTLPSPVKPFPWPIPSPTPPPLSPCQDLPSYSTTDLEHYRLSFDSGLADDFRNDQRNPESQEVDSVRGEFPPYCRPEPMV